MIREGISADSPIKYTAGIGILFDRTEIEHPEALPMAVLQEFLGVLATIAVQAFNASGGVSHDDHSVGDVHQICGAETASSACATVCGARA